MRQALQSGRTIQAIIALLMAGGLVFWLVAEAGKPAGTKKLKVATGDLRSIASEAVMLIDQAEAGRLTANFFRIESSLLSEKAASTAQSAATSRPQAGLEGLFAQTAGMAQQAANELHGLSSSFGNREVMESAKKKLAEIKQQALRLEESLRRS
ncbi:MAG TPA: hypothetical protein VNQ79_27830 [Blastocatellia bacterium]|nr:hypothetical protein [Blastocatellia bacterium]